MIILIGPRQVGKTTLIQSLTQHISEKEKISFNGDFLGDRRDIQISSQADMNGLFGAYQYIIIDEAQKIENI